MSAFFFFFNDPPTPEIYPLPLHDSFPISEAVRPVVPGVVDRAGHLAQDEVLERARHLGDGRARQPGVLGLGIEDHRHPVRSEEHTSELQSRQYLVCRLLLEKKKPNIQYKM